VCQRYVNTQADHVAYGYLQPTVCSCSLRYVVRSTIGYHSNSWASCYFWFSSPIRCKQTLTRNSVDMHAYGVYKLNLELKKKTIHNTILHSYFLKISSVLQLYRLLYAVRSALLATATVYPSCYIGYRPYTSL